MPRTVSSPTLGKASGAVSEPCYLLQIDWIGLTTRMCTHSTVSWNAFSWFGTGLTIAFDGTGRPTSITLADPDAAYRTLALGSGLTDRRVQLWKAYVGALDVSDPVPLFDGFADGASIGDGRVVFSLDYPKTARQFTPRERIGPNIGINFMGAPGTKVYWANQILDLQSQ